MKPEVAVFERSSGALLYVTTVANAPARDDDDRASNSLPVDYDEALHRWDSDALAFVVDLPALRARQWGAVRSARDIAQDGGCLTPSGRVDTDAESRGKISGSVQMAMIALQAQAPFEIAWTMQDNSTVVHDALAMIAMGVAVGQHVAACHAEALSRRTLIEEAEDEASIHAVPIEGGWPGAPA